MLNGSSVENIIFITDFMSRADVTDKKNLDLIMKVAANEFEVQ